MAEPTKLKPRDGNRRVSELHRIGQNRPANHTEMPDVGVLLNKLERVKPTAKGWSARCPSHEDRNASLSVAVGDEGRLLVHCFAGCSIGEIVDAAGLDIAELFPRRMPDTSPQGKREANQFVRMSQWRAALNVLSFEATVVTIAANELREGRTLSANDEARLVLARERIVDARTVLT